MLKLSDLNPKFGATNGVRTHIIFDAPGCQHEDKCRIVIPFAGESLCKWQKTGDDFTSLTLSPSIWFNKGQKNPTTCDVHFFVRNGEIIYA